MAKFLDTTGISYHLEQIIKNAEERLIIISPYLKINDRIKELLVDKNLLKIDVRVIYGKNELQPEENNWLRSMDYIKTSFCKNLHAKCYMNEKEALITSMNLYEFSQANNNEMGIYIIKSEDSQLFKDIYAESKRLIRISEEIKILVEKIDQEKELKPKKEKQTKRKQQTNKQMGYCIRTGVEIPFNVEKPMSYSAFKSWSNFNDPDFAEKFCHFSRESSNGETSVNKPILHKYWKEAKKLM